MRRVYAVWLARRVWHSLWLKLALLALLAVNLHEYVAPRLVWQNLQTSGGLTNYQFFFSAFARTEGIVQSLTLVSIIILAWLGRDAWLKLANPSTRLGFSSPVRS